MKKQLPELLNYDEKKKLIEILIIVGGLLTALNRYNLNIILIFTLFIVSSIIYYVWISAIQKVNRKINDRYTIHFTEFLSALVSFSFTGILVTIGIQGLNLTEDLLWLYLPLFVFLYAILGLFLMLVFVKIDDFKKDEKVKGDKNTNLKLHLRRLIPIFWFIFWIAIFLIVFNFISDYHILRLSIALQIIGVLFTSLWKILKYLFKSSALKWVTNLTGKIVKKLNLNKDVQGWVIFKSFFFVTGIAFIISGFIGELILI